MNNKISICFATDNGYAPYMGMAILSILTNAGKEENFHFYVLYNKISNENKKKVESLKKIRPFEITWLPLNEELFMPFYYSPSLTLCSMRFEST